ncbi:LppU/SCO3897 family protein [Saccharothrix sp. ALI-22-I]|uniref:LppU/SCO3897 family protein n=1 Tax=Saccharothrix sp. ALI-22-I TaxID=1933778 RepID=UPI00097CB2B8|nr:hypothetical protein [Saccharothrix sp. ALI-22-I]
MSNEPNRPAEDAPKATPTPSGASPAEPASPSPATPPASGSAAADPAADPDVPPADAERIAAPGAAAGGSAAGATAGATAAFPQVPEAHQGSETTRGSGVNVTKIVIGVLVLLLIGIGVVGVFYLFSGSTNAEAGDCVSLTAEADNRAEVETLDCDEDKASYKVGKVLEATEDTCPEEGLYTEIAPAGSVGDGFKLCLLPNMAEGACYKPDEGTGFVKTDCTGPETIKVTKVIQGSTDTNACPDAAGMSYPEPPVTYCLAPAEL